MPARAEEGRLRAEATSAQTISIRHHISSLSTSHMWHVWTVEGGTFRAGKTSAHLSGDENCGCHYTQMWWSAEAGEEQFLADE
jgi:hypothetical protein